MSTVILCAAFLCATLAAWSFARLARKRAHLVDVATAAARTAQAYEAREQQARIRAEHERDRLRSMLVYRTDHASVYDLTDAQLRRLLTAIATHGKPSKASPATLEQLIGPDSSIVEEPGQ